MAFALEKLKVYQKAIAFADAICTLPRDLPRWQLPEHRRPTGKN